MAKGATPTSIHAKAMRRAWERLRNIGARFFVPSAFARQLRYAWAEVKAEAARAAALVRSIAPEVAARIEALRSEEYTLVMRDGSLFAANQRLEVIRSEIRTLEAS
ncbi:hypothetical protein [Flaviflagellibacter deserti]|uniref:Uncharacterized protein n=1 Tax=Flaviflagellibacter deserti TaxID=2267266 RepID=A0ABV9Z2S5_9HYPH